LQKPARSKGTRFTIQQSFNAKSSRGLLKSLRS
jgi:hypothetical protein